MPKKLPWEDWRPGDDEFTSGWMRATSPGGSVSYQNTVSWSGELGYGVRAPEQGQNVMIEAKAEVVDAGHSHDHDHDGHDHDGHDHENGGH